MAKNRVRDNFNRFQKYATINITKKLQKTADEIKVDIMKVVEDKLLETYKNNVLLSYVSRSAEGLAVAEYNRKAKEAEQKDRELGLNTRHRRKKLTYRHTNTFINAIHTKTEENRIKIVLDDSTYDNGKSVAEVYKYLTKGTKGGDAYAYDNNGEIKSAYNYPTPEHDFEIHTKLQMEGFLNNLNLKDYAGARRYRIKKRR